VTFAFFFRKRHDSPAAGGYPQASTTKAAAGFYALWSVAEQCIKDWGSCHEQKEPDESKAMTSCSVAEPFRALQLFFIP